MISISKDPKMSKIEALLNEQTKACAEVDRSLTVNGHKAVDKLLKQNNNRKKNLNKD